MHTLRAPTLQSVFTHVDTLQRTHVLVRANTHPPNCMHTDTCVRERELRHSSCASRLVGQEHSGCNARKTQLIERTVIVSALSSSDPYFAYSYPEPSYSQYYGEPLDIYCFSTAQDILARSTAVSCHAEAVPDVPGRGLTCSGGASETAIQFNIDRLREFHSGLYRCRTVGHTSFAPFRIIGSRKSPKTCPCSQKHCKLAIT